MGGWMGVEPSLRDCFAQSNNLLVYVIIEKCTKSTILKSDTNWTKKAYHLICLWTKCTSHPALSQKRFVFVEVE